MADTSSGISVGEMADHITSSFTSLSKVITAQSYLAGLGFSVGAIMKFKQHKDNPTQVPIGTPAALMAVAAILTFLPSIKATASAAGVTAPDVRAAAESAGVTKEKAAAAAESAGVTKESAESAAESAGATPAQVSAAETELKAKLSG